jgi:hypothetical protein
MTLLLALANDSYSMVLGDRRLSRNGVVCEDESNKICVLFCDDARVVIAYTGVAVHKGFRTQDWLRDTLDGIGKTEHTFEKMMDRLQAAATLEFKRFPVSYRHTAFLITGYKYTDTRSEHICWLLSNFDPDIAGPTAGTSMDFYDLETPGEVVVKAAGFTSVLKESDYSELREMLQSNAPAPRVLHKAVRIVQRVAKEPASRRSIGSQCNSAVVDCKVDTMVTNTYHSARPVSRATGPDIVFAVNGDVMSVTGMLLDIEGAVVAGPDIRKNQLCFCGSGVKFGACHRKKYGSVYARLPGFHRPMSMTFQVGTKKPVPSGQRFGVFGAFD